MTRPFALLTALVAALAASSGTARADLIVVPNANATVEGNSDNAFPFNPVFGPMRYQQVYAASQFAAPGGPQLITEIRFRQDGEFGTAFSATLPNVRIDLSTTAAQPGALSTTFASNLGANNTTVFSGALTLSSAASVAVPRPFDIVIPLATPFLYDPTAGNLLMDVRIFTGATTTAFDAVDTFGTGVTSRLVAFDPNATTGSDDGAGRFDGLVTAFTVTAAAVPEPATLAVFAGMAGVGGLVARRRKLARG